MIEASHILFAVTPRSPLNAVRAKAEAVLREIRHNRALFGDYARRYSNWPSAKVGGNLGHLARGEAVPEFEAALLKEQTTGILLRLVNTRFGFHVVRIERRIGGVRLPFAAVQSRIAAYLVEHVRRKAIQQYLGVLAGRAEIVGNRARCSGVALAAVSAQGRRG